MRNFYTPLQITNPLEIPSTVSVNGIIYKLKPGQTLYRMAHTQSSGKPDSVAVHGSSSQISRLAVNGEKEYFFVPSRKQSVRPINLSEDLKENKGQ